jgi:hypothetical protein
MPRPLADDAAEPLADHSGALGAVNHCLRRRQVVASTLSEIWAFFKEPRNLESITPPWLGFRIVGASDRDVRVGTTIHYRLRLHGFPFQWESRIAEYVEGEQFADEQVRGPYRHWYHRHRFTSVEGGVAIEDEVDYQLPIGFLGRIAHAVAVRRQLQEIFDYRAQVIGRRFPTGPDRDDTSTSQPAVGGATTSTLP